MQALKAESARTLYSLLTVASARYRIECAPDCARVDLKYRLHFQVESTNDKCQMRNGKFHPTLLVLGSCTLDVGPLCAFGELCQFHQ
jgi:hypothetical protein